MKTRSAQTSADRHQRLRAKFVRPVVPVDRVEKSVENRSNWRKAAYVSQKPRQGVVHWATSSSVGWSDGLHG
jgi:hypothetical protein